MKNLSLLSILIYIATGLYSKNFNHYKLPYKDSIELVNTWQKFKLSLELKDKNTLRRLSLKTVHCDLSQTPNLNASFEQNVNNSYISFDKFLVQFYHNSSISKLRAAIKTSKYYIGESEMHIHPPNIYNQKTKSIILYDVSYITIKPNETAKGNEGESEGFEFIKIDGKYKFFGLTSVP